MEALTLGHTNIAKLLIKAGADANAKNVVNIVFNFSTSTTAVLLSYGDSKWVSFKLSLSITIYKRSKAKSEMGTVLWNDIISYDSSWKYTYHCIW